MDGISQLTWAKLKAVDAKLVSRKNNGESYDVVTCEAIQECFDILCGEYIETGSHLDAQLLFRVIPDRVKDITKALGWLPEAITSNWTCWVFEEWFSNLIQ